MGRENIIGKGRLALVFGATGQIGSYMVESLLADNYIVYGVNRRTSTDNTWRLKEALKDPNFYLVHGDITDSGSILRLFKELHSNYYFEDHPVHIYNFAASSHVALSFNDPAANINCTLNGHLNLLEICRENPYNFPTLLFFANSSETFGSEVDPSGFQYEYTIRQPNSPYAVAKLAAHHLNRIYRDSYKMQVASGTLFNTESPRRGENFVTRKITKWFGELVANKGEIKQKLQLGNLDAHRDWTHASDTVRAIRLMMDRPKLEDFLVASGQTHSIKEFLELTYMTAVSLSNVELPPLVDCYEINQSFLRPNEVRYLKGWPEKLYRYGWKPEIKFTSLITEMVAQDIMRAGGRDYIKCLS